MRRSGTLIPALAVSILLHSLLLWPATSRHPDDAAAAALVATLRPALNPAGGLSPGPSIPGKLPTQETGNRKLAQQTRIRPPEPQQTSLPPAGAQLPQHITHASTVEMPQRSPQRSETVAKQANEMAAGPAAPLAAAPPDAEGLRQYRLALALEARRFRRYPARALEANLGGTVEVRVAVAAAGAPEDIALAHSSGHELLDDAALDMLRKAAPRTVVPDRLRGRTFVVSLPVVFDLADE